MEAFFLYIYNYYYGGSREKQLGFEHRVTELFLGVKSKLVWDCVRIAEPVVTAVEVLAVDCGYSC